MVISPKHYHGKNTNSAANSNSTSSCIVYNQAACDVFRRAWSQTSEQDDAGQRPFASEGGKGATREGKLGPGCKTVAEDGSAHEGEARSDRWKREEWLTNDLGKLVILRGHQGPRRADRHQSPITKFKSLSPASGCTEIHPSNEWTRRTRRALETEKKCT